MSAQRRQRKEKGEEPNQAHKSITSGTMTPADLARVQKGLLAAFPGEEIGENLDILVLLNFALFMEGLAKAADNEVRAKTRPKKVVFETQHGEEKVAVYSVRHKDLEMIAEEELRKMRG